MKEWRELAERLVELDMAIEDLGSWATAPEDVYELKRLESLRDELQQALAERRVTRHLRERLDMHGRPASQPLTFDPRD
jgi:hypothetical protein